MKKLSAFLIVLVLVFGTMLSVAAQGENSGSGIILGFTDTSVDLKVGGKLVNYKISPVAKVIQNDMEANFADIAKKGLKIGFKENAGLITYMDIPSSGIESIGIIDKVASQNGQLMLAIKEVRENTTDSSLVATSKDAVKIGEEDDDAYQYKSLSVVNLGDITIVPNTMKVKVDGKELKVLEKGEAFTSAAIGDEVKLMLNKTFYSLEFEKAFSDAVTDAEQLAKVLTISFKKAMYKLTTTELNSYPVSEEVVTELNGKLTSFVDTLAKSREAEVRTNADGEIVYIGGYYKNFVAQVLSIDNNVMNIYVRKNGKVILTEAIEISGAANFISPSGGVIEAKDIYKDCFVEITVDPYDSYRVINVQRLYY